MKLLLIKIGKAWHTIRREGLMRGGRRVLAAALAMFRRVESGDILFITGGVGDSARYRTTHIAEALRMQGFKTSVTVQDNPFLPTYADKFSIFIFHRVLYTPSVAKLISRIKAVSKEIIFETDDLVYDPVFLKHMDYFKQMNKLERKLYENGVGGEILADPNVKVCTTTTSFLANKLREKGKEVFIVSNKLSNKDLKIADSILTTNNKQQTTNKKVLNSKINQSVKIGYFSGTLSHNKDFATITNALIEILEKYQQVELLLMGPLDIEDKLNKFKNKIKRFPRVSREKYFAAVANVDINLAPLEIGNPFCEAKSELKWIEAGLVGVPTVAAGTQTFREAITDGVDGYVASTTEEWIEKIGKLITDKNLRKQMGEKAREKVLARYTTKTSDSDYVEYLRTKLKN